MARTRFAPDRGLSARMGLTMFLLGLLYVVLIIAIWYAIGNVFLALVISAALLWGQWYFSDRLALHAMRGQVVTPEQTPQLHAMIDRLCALADMPKPQVAVADVDMPNAFATGRSPQRAVICVTTGLLRRVQDRELEAVLSHELSHVAHRDVTVMTVASFVAVLAGFMTRSLMWSGMGGSRRRDNNNGPPVFLIVMLVSMVVYAVSYVLIRALSRYRELAADRAGAFLTGQPSALASALVKISGEMGRIPTQDLRRAQPYNAFFFTPAFSDRFDFTSLFSTHPPLEKRLEQLARISAELGRPAL